MWPGVLARSLPSAQALAGDRPGSGPVAKPKPVLPAHGGQPSACQCWPLRLPRGTPRRSEAAGLADYQGDRAAARRRGRRVVIDHPVAEHRHPVDTDLEAGLLEQVRRRGHGQADRVGDGTSAGPDDTSTVTVSPWWYAEPAAGCCPTIVPCAAVLLEVCGVSRFTPCALAHCSAACTFIPKKLGSGGLAATRIATGFVCGHDVPATGLVPSTVPTGADEPTFCSLPVRCARARAACACASVSFFTTGTMDVNGPE